MGGYGGLQVARRLLDARGQLARHKATRATARAVARAAQRRSRAREQAELGLSAEADGEADGKAADGKAAGEDADFDFDAECALFQPPLEFICIHTHTHKTFRRNSFGQRFHMLVQALPSMHLGEISST